MNSLSYQCSVCGEVPVYGHCPHDCDEVLCDECTTDLGEPAEWHDTPESQRIPCDRCGKQ